MNSVFSTAQDNAIGWQRCHYREKCLGKGCIRKNHCVFYFTYLLSVWQVGEEDLLRVTSSLCEVEKKDMFSNFAPTIFPVLAERAKYEFQSVEPSVYNIQVCDGEPYEMLPKEDEDGKDEEP